MIMMTMEVASAVTMLLSGEVLTGDAVVVGVEVGRRLGCELTAARVKLVRDEKSKE